MILRSCAKENDVAQMLANGHWPQACAPELRTHIGACPSCADLIMVARVFQSARADAASAAHLGSPHALWWRAQLRRRNAAIERVTRPILGAQIFALLICFVVAVGFSVSHAAQGIGWISDLTQLIRLPSIDMAKLWPSSTQGSALWVLVPLAAMLALLGGVAVYLASSEER